MLSKILMAHGLAMLLQLLSSSRIASNVLMRSTWTELGSKLKRKHHLCVHSLDNQVQDFAWNKDDLHDRFAFKELGHRGLLFGCCNYSVFLNIFWHLQSSSQLPIDLLANIYAQPDRKSAET